jgi:putative membrane protein
MEAEPRRALPAIASAAAVLAASGLLLCIYDPGPMSAHMAIHIAAMNIVAPLGAVLLARKPADRAAAAWIMAAVQIGLLWIWHAPPLQRAAIESGSLQVVMHVSLMLTALAFWQSLLRLPPRSRWQAVAVLLLTAKLTCLLAVLMIFAPRVLHQATVPVHTAHHWASAPLADQQLAGLFMIASCLLSYVVAGVIFAAQTIADLERTSNMSRRRTFSAAS